MSYKGILHPKGDNIPEWIGPEVSGTGSIAENALSAGWSCFYFSFIPMAGVLCLTAIVPCAVVAMIMGEKREGIKLLLVSATTFFLVSLICGFIALMLGSVIAQQVLFEAARNLRSGP